MTRMRLLTGLAVGLLITGGPAWCKPVLRDGLYAKSVQGHIEVISDTGQCLFQIQSDIKDQNTVVPKGTQFEFLPCAMLEILLGDTRVQPSTDVRIWAKITQYQGKNYLFLMNYLCLSPLADNLPDTQVADVNSLAKTDRIEIPDFVKKQVAEQRIVHIAPLPEVAKPASNKIMINRFGHIGTRDGQKVFVFDGLGYSADAAPIGVLPCQALEHIETIQKLGVGPYRFNIAGMTTMFRGKQYIYIQRAFRVFNYGNFGQ